MLTLNSSTRPTLPPLWQHPWVKMDEKEPLQPLCDKDLEVTVQKLLGSRWAESQSSENLSLNRPTVGPQSILVKPSLAMKDFTIQKPQPPSPEISTITPAWLFLRETTRILETTHDSEKRLYYHFYTRRLESQNQNKHKRKTLIFSKKWSGPWLPGGS